MPSAPICRNASRSPIGEHNHMLVLPSLSRVILSSRNPLLPVYLASTSRSLPRHPLPDSVCKLMRGMRTDCDDTSRPLAIITRRSTRRSGRPMSILSGTLTRYYSDESDRKFAFLSLSFWRNETLRARFEAGHHPRISSPRVIATPRTSSREICLSHAVSSRASLPGHYFNRLTRDQSFLIPEEQCVS